MKYLIQGLLSLVLLGFIYAQSGMTRPTGRPMSTPDKDSNSTGNGTNPHNNNNNNNQNPGGSGSTTTPSGSNSMTGHPGSPGTGGGGQSGKPSMTTKNGESHIVTSVGLLFASAVLHTLWQ